jgi:sodium-dependent dicarboxylate transporter 2/3/5
MIPSGTEKHRPLLSWQEISHGVPWGVLLLFGGGFAIANAVHVSHLDKWLGSHLHFLSSLPMALAILAIAAIATSVTELTSNTAMATLLIPVMAARGDVIHISPYLLMTTAAVACSYAFMLPVATPPNAIVMGSGHVRMVAMFRQGIKLNIISALLLTAFILTLGKWVLPT